MDKLRRMVLIALIGISCAGVLAPLAGAQEAVTVLTGGDLTRVVPPGFYYQGLSAPTQMRNSAAARFGAKRFVIAALVDTSGYAADVRARYQGFLITDSAIQINGIDLGVGAYGFGFSSDGQMHVLDLADKQILSVSTNKDAEAKRPRPLEFVKSGDGVRFYNGRDFVTITVK